VLAERPSRIACLLRLSGRALKAPPTTNPIESTFVTVRLRHRRTKGSGSRVACLTMVYKLMQSAEKKWSLLNGSDILPGVVQGIKFNHGVKETRDAA